MQIVPTTKGIKEAIRSALGNDLPKEGERSGKQVAASFGKTLAKGLAAIGIGKIIGNAITAGTEYQNSIAKLGTIADTSAVSIDSMKTKIADMSDQLGISQADIAEAAYSTISATGDTAGALDVVAQAAKLATAGFTDTDSAISVLTTAMNAYGMETDNVQHISDSLITTQNLGVTTVAELASNMGRAIATASGYGVSMENLEAAYISTTKAGISTAESTTYLSSMIQELGKDGSTVSDILKDKTGKSFAELMNSGSSLGDVLKVLMDSVDGNSEAFMNLWSSQEAGKSANAIANQGISTFNDNLKTLQNQAGTTQAAYENMTDTFAWKSQDLKTKLENLGIDLFNAMYPVLNDLTQEAMDFVDHLDVEAVADDITGFVQDAIPLIELAGDALETVAENLGLIIPLVGAFIGFDLTTKALGLAVGIMGIFKNVKSLAPVIAALSGPVGLVIALVAGVVGGLFTLYKTNESFRNAVNDTWESIKNFLSETWETIKNAAEETWNSMTQAISAFLGQASETFSNIWQSVSDTVSNAWETIKNVVTVGIMLIGEIISAGIQIITLPFQFIWENCKGIITEAWNSISMTVSDTLSMISDVISSVWNGISDLLSPILEGIKGNIESSWDNVKSNVSSVSDGIKSTVSDKWSSIKSTVNDKMSGIKSTVSEKWDAAKNKTSSAIDAMKSKISAGLGSARSTVNSILGAIKDKFSSIFNACKNVVSNAIDAIKSKFHFSWSLPHLKLPHVSISGRFSINPPSVPHFSVSWYDKGGIFDRPTVIGVGEKRPEFVGALDDLRGIVRDEAGGNDMNTAYLLRLLEMAEKYFPEFAKDKQLILNDKFIGEVAPEMDKRLGDINRMKARYV